MVNFLNEGGKVEDVIEFSVSSLSSGSQIPACGSPSGSVYIFRSEQSYRCKRSIRGEDKGERE